MNDTADSTNFTCNSTTLDPMSICYCLKSLAPSAKLGVTRVLQFAVSGALFEGLSAPNIEFNGGKLALCVFLNR